MTEKDSNTPTGAEDSPSSAESLPAKKAQPGNGSVQPKPSATPEPRAIPALLETADHREVTGASEGPTPMGEPPASLNAPPAPAPPSPFTKPPPKIEQPTPEADTAGVSPPLSQEGTSEVAERERPAEPESDAAGKISAPAQSTTQAPSPIDEKPAEGTAEPTPTKADIQISFVLPNAKRGEPYLVKDIKAKLFGDHEGAVSTYYFEGLDDTGLALHPDDDTVSGEPMLPENEPKTVDLQLCYHLKEAPRSPPARHAMRFVINPNPRALWKNIPSDHKMAYWKADEASEQIEASGGLLFAASKRGRSHAHDGTCRDDDFAIRYFGESGWWLSVVADGAGSAKYSRRGAQMACETGSKLFEQSIKTLESEAVSQAIKSYCDGESGAEPAIHQFLSNIFINEVGYNTFSAIFEHARKGGDRVKEYNTTFIVTAWKRLDPAWFVCAFAIGDGGVAVLSGDSVTPLSVGDEGEYSGETVFLTTRSVWERENAEGLLTRVRFGAFDDVRGIFSMTDGITDPMFETDHNFGRIEKWRALETDLEGALGVESAAHDHEKLLDWLDFWSAGNHDDRTLSIFRPARNVAF